MRATFKIQIGAGALAIQSAAPTARVGDTRPHRGGRRTRGGPDRFGC
jgi:hypothetical protein